MKNKIKVWFKELLTDALTVFAILLIGFGHIIAAEAQSDISDSTGIVGNGRYLGAKTVDGQLTVPVLGVNSSGNTELNANSGKAVAAAVAKTPVASFDSNGLNLASEKSLIQPASSAVMASTPVAGTNYFPAGLSIVPTTATANHAAFVGVATPVAGSQFRIYNSSAVSVYVKAAGGATINGTQAAGRFILAAKCTVDCAYTSATNLYCSPPVCATPLAP